VVVVSSLTSALLQNILADLEQRRDWRAARSAVIVCWIDVGSESAARAASASEGRTLPPDLRELGDAERLEPGARYYVPAHQRAWFEGMEVRLGSRGPGEHRPIDRLLLSLGEGWGSQSAAVLALPHTDDGECGLRIIRAVGGIALQWAAPAPPVAAPIALLEPHAEGESKPEPGFDREGRAVRVFSVPSNRLAAARAACAAVAQRVRARGRIRIWHPGCQAGGLTYAIAMLLSDALRQRSASARALVFGTDTDEEALAIARAGRYPAGAALGMDPELRARYTFDEAGTIRVAEALREICIFSRNELGRDLPMARVDLIVSHRVFDGLDERQRGELVDAFHYSLRDGGLLLALDHLDVFPESRFERMEGGYLRARPRVGSFRAALSAPTAQEPASAAHDASARPPLELGLHGLEPLVHAIGVPLISCDEQLRVVFATREAQAAFGLSPGHRGSELAAIADGLPGGLDLVPAAQRALVGGETQELTIRRRQNTYLARISSAGGPGGARVTIAFTDVTALEAAKAQAVAQQHRQVAIARLSELALRSPESRRLYDEALELLFGNVHACTAGIIVECGEAGGAFEVVASRGLGADPLGALRRMGDAAVLLNEVVERRCVVWQSGERAAWGGPSAPGGGGRPRPAPRRPSTASVARAVGCPILAEGEVLGVIALYGRGADIDDSEYQPFLRAVANVLGGAILRQKTRRRLAFELEVSRALAGASTLEGVGDALRQTLQAMLGADEVELWAARGGSLDGWARLWASGGEPSAAEPSAAPPSWLPGLLAGAASGAPVTAGERRELCIPLDADGVPRRVLVLRGVGQRQPDRDLAPALANIGRMLSAVLERLQSLEVSRQNEASYRQKSAELEALCASLPVGVSIHDQRGRVRYINRQLAELEALGEGPSAHAVRRLYAEELPAWVARVLELGEPVHDVELSVVEGGQTHAWLCNFAPIRDGEGGVHGASAVVQDITALKRVEVSLREADHQKDDFLAILGHELRNPIAAIRSATELLGRIEAATPQLIRLQAILERQTLQTTKLIDGLLDVARVARGKVELELAPVPVAQIVRQAVDDHQQQFRGRSLDCRLPEEELWVHADRVRLMQVLDNLISNALEFTAPGGRISITVSGSGQRGTIQVDDDGAGIDPDLLPQIFDAFRQGRTKSAGPAGLGLGLALVKGLAELHGFDVRATSEGRGRGASFRIEFPLIAAPESPAPVSRVDLRPLDLLLVEDNPDIVETLSELLTVAGHRVRSAGTAEEALELLRAQRPDVLLCDIGLPGMSGLELGQRLRADPELAGIKRVAMTGYGDPATQGHIARAGFERTLIKPVQLAALRHCLSRVAAATPPDVDAATPATPG
jgi:PAS domain S-box-containing protein